MAYQVEQYVMAYRVEQEAVRSLLTGQYTSLRPVLRLNLEIIQDKDDRRIRVEFNTPVAAAGKRGWLNLITWESETDQIMSAKDGLKTTFSVGLHGHTFLDIDFVRVGKEGGCPREDDNDGTFFIDPTINKTVFRGAEQPDNNKEFCDCRFRWTLPVSASFGAKEDLVRAAMRIPSEQILGAYVVCFDRA